MFKKAAALLMVLATVMTLSSCKSQKDISSEISSTASVTSVESKPVVVSSKEEKPVSSKVTTVSKNTVTASRPKPAEAEPTAEPLSNTLYKLNVKKELRIAYFGGSVTQGYGATDPATKSWRALTTAWLKKSYPNAEITENDAAVGGTGSDFGMYRAVRDLCLDDINRKPDLLFIEFGINDAYDGLGQKGAMNGLESIINTVYDYSPDTDIVIILTTDNNRKATVYDEIYAHIKVAEHYKLPYLKIGQMLWEEIAAEAKSAAKDFESIRAKYFPALSGGGYDYVHPNDVGYAKYAGYVTNYLGGILGKLKTPAATANVYKPRKTLTRLPEYPSATSAINVVSGANGFYTEQNAPLNLLSNVEGSSFTVKFTGTELKLWAWGYKYPATISVSIDGKSAKDIELFREGGNNKVFTLAQRLVNKEHTAKITYKAAPTVPSGETDPEPFGPKVKIRDFFTSGSEDPNFYMVR